MKLIINRKKWGTGRLGGELRNPKTGLQCCLGFMGRSCGIPEESLDGIGLPHNVKKKTAKRHKKLWSVLVNDENYTTTSLARVNDSPKTSLKWKESHITKLFAKIGVIVEFKG